MMKNKQSCWYLPQRETDLSKCRLGWLMQIDLSGTNPSYCVCDQGTSQLLEVFKVWINTGEGLHKEFITPDIRMIEKPKSNKGFYHIPAFEHTHNGLPEGYYWMWHHIEHRIDLVRFYGDRDWRDSGSGSQVTPIFYSLEKNESWHLPVRAYHENMIAPVYKPIKEGGGIINYNQL